MPRIRTLKPEFWTDEKVGLLSRDERLLFIGLISTADDQGRFRAAPATVRAAVFPHDDDLTRQTIESWLGRLHDSGVVVLYESGGERFGAIRNWRRHQKVDHPARARIPEPPEDIRNPREGLAKVPEGLARTSVILAPHTSDHGPPTSDHLLAASFADATSPPAPHALRAQAQPIEPVAPATSSPEQFVLVPDVPEAPPVVSFPVSGLHGGEWGLSRSFLQELRTAYPALDVEAEARRARVWVLSNPRNKKTPEGMPRFLNSWMTKAQNSAGRAPEGGPRPPPLKEL